MISSDHSTGHLATFAKKKKSREDVARQLLASGGTSWATGALVFPGAMSWLSPQAQRAMWSDLAAQEGLSAALAAHAWMSLLDKKRTSEANEFSVVWSHAEPEARKEAWRDHAKLREAWAKHRAECAHLANCQGELIAQEIARGKDAGEGFPSESKSHGQAPERIESALLWIDRLIASASFEEMACDLLEEALSAYSQPGQWMDHCRRAKRGLAWLRMPGAAAQKTDAKRADRLGRKAAQCGTSPVSRSKRQSFFVSLSLRMMESSVEKNAFNQAFADELAHGLSEWATRVASQKQEAQALAELSEGAKPLASDFRKKEKERVSRKNLASLACQASSTQRAEVFWPIFWAQSASRDLLALKEIFALGDQMLPRDGLRWMARLAASSHEGPPALAAEPFQKAWAHQWTQFAGSCGSQQGDVELWAMAERASRGAGPVVKTCAEQARSRFHPKHHPQLAAFEAQELNEAIAALDLASPRDEQELDWLDDDSESPEGLEIDGERESARPKKRKTNRL